MDERALLLLGILKQQSQHGYRLHEFIERNLGRITDMKKATAYATLDRLSDAGHVSVELEQEGNRPPRKVYTITPEGDAHFLVLLRENLESADRMASPGDVGLMFLDHVPRADAVACLRRRRERVAAQLTTYESTPRHGEGLLGVDLAVEHLVALLRTEHAWIGSVIDRLEREKS